ncbi:hypothetical protein SAMN05216464_12912 [Mucilaginibacter pineti]|uniref:Uncharacterized protein n=1 Tax=Mucilaginibacter pineti TaxID=1391627 RepID=A0A1G7NRK6_9SPHI|nr:hypothetical protein SAMN05216464_12912 [Mucilaginibacter pineti]
MVINDNLQSITAKNYVEQLIVGKEVFIQHPESLLRKLFAFPIIICCRDSSKFCCYGLTNSD